MKKFSIFHSLLLALFLVPFVSCSDDDTTDVGPQSIVEIASGDEQFSTLVSALDRVGLVSVLEGDGPFTVFAPTNAAFTASGIDLDALSDEALTEVLLYHVLSGAAIASGDLGEGQTYASTAANTGPGDTQLSMLIEKAGTNVTINGSTSVSTADVTATNGIIHIVNEVILPLDIVGHATANSSFSSLVTTLGAASGDLTSVLSGSDIFTVFAPVNSAFDAISSTTATLDADQLATVLTYHVVTGNVVSSGLSDGLSVATVNGESFTVNIDGTAVTLTSSTGGTSTVFLTDVQATNGVIHALDAVIIPTNL